MRQVKQRDAERTKAALLDAAAIEFAEKGYASARVEDIAQRVGLTKRLVFYYFESKEKLYIAALESAYQHIRTQEAALGGASLPPREALARISAFTFDYYVAHPGFVRLVASENIEGGAFLAKSGLVRASNRGVIELLEEILERGRNEGIFRKDVGATDVHMTISSLAFFCIANRHTFGTLFDVDMNSSAFLEAKRAQIVDIVDRFVRELTS
jgi:AcrR family transcriptional regulator